MKSIYLDHAAAAPLSDSMKNYLISLLPVYGNPSSLHTVGVRAGQLITQARASVAGFLNAAPDDIFFTGGGSAGNTLAVRGLVTDKPPAGQYEVFYSPTAHKSMLLACESCTYHTPLTVNSFGEISPTALDDLLSAHNRLRPFVCIEAAGSETGTIQDIAGIGSVVKKHNGLLLVDATGYIPSYPVDMGLWAPYVDMLTFSGHKLRALKGVGVLWKRRGIRLSPLIYGTQERGLIGGTENTLGIASLGKAAADYDYASITSRHRDYVYEYIVRRIPDCTLVGAPISSGRRLPRHLYLCFHGIEGESMMILLDLYGIQVSTGSACSQKNPAPPAALHAIGMKPEDMHSCIRITFSGEESKEDLDYVCGKLKQCAASLRKTDAAE